MLGVFVQVEEYTKVESPKVLNMLKLSFYSSKGGDMCRARFMWHSNIGLPSRLWHILALMRFRVK